MLFPIFLSLILLTLGIFHINWAFGNQYGFAALLPTNEGGERVLNPKKIDSAVVGIGLIAFGVFYFLKSGFIAVAMPDWITNYCGWIIPIIFILRTIGDFKYIGFFKKIRHTKFGILDTLFFSPLCLMIGVIGIVIQV